MNPTYVECTYYVESSKDVRKVAEELVGEQSAGTFLKVPGQSQELQEVFGGRVLHVESEGTREPSLSSRFESDVVNAGRVTVAYPTVNTGGDLTTLLTIIAGNLFELANLTACRVESMVLPADFQANHKGPEFGLDGTWKSVNLEQGAGPLIGTIVKPNIGLRSDGFRKVVRDLLDAGIDFIKDDELNADPAHLTFDERVRIVGEEVDRAADRLGRRIPYAFNVAGPISELERKHALVRETGGLCVMLPVFHQGVSSLEYLRSLGGLQLHAHRAGYTSISRHPALGMDFTVWQQIVQLAGADHIHVSGIRSKFAESDEQVAKNITAIQAGMSEMVNVSAPVLSSGQTVFAAAPTFEHIASTDVMVLAGGGILAHPQGATAGVESLREAWVAAREGTPLEVAAKNALAEGRESLQSAVDFFGGRL